METSFTNEEYEAIRRRDRELAALLKAVLGEVNECNAFLKAHDTPFWRRVACRSIFASIEALTNHLKQNTLLHTFGEEDFFTDAEKLALNDREYSVTDRGEVKERGARIRTLPNILLAFDSFSRVCGQKFAMPKPEGWESLKKAIKIRDRITHPKVAADYEISDQEFAEINKAWIWFSTTLRDVTQIARDIAESVMKKPPQK